MDKLTFNELRSKCKQMKLKPCAGKGVDKRFLLQLIGGATLTDDEIKIKAHDPNLYESIKPFVPSMPDAERCCP